MVKLELNRQ